MLTFATSLPGWAFLMLLVFLHYAAPLSQSLWRRLTSLIRVSLRGWPPAHLDADGDWRPAIKKDPTHD
jgi:hypothetical protein